MSMLMLCPTLVCAAPAPMEKTLLFGSQGAMPDPAMTEGAVMHIINKSFRDFEKGREASWKAGCAPNVRFTNPSLGFDVIGVDNVWANVRQFVTTVPPNVNANPNAEFVWMLAFSSHEVDLESRTVSVTMQAIMKQSAPESNLKAGEVATLGEWQLGFDENWKATSINHDMYYSFFLANNGYGGSNFEKVTNETGSFP